MTELKTLKDIFHTMEGLVSDEELKAEAVKIANWYDGYKDNIDWRKVFLKFHNLKEEDLQ